MPSLSSSAIVKTPRLRTRLARPLVAEVRSRRPAGGGRRTTAAAEQSSSRAKVVTADLAYILEIERFEAKVGGSDEVTPIALRVTSIFRQEDGSWKLVHRHADPITGLRPAESVIQT